jgi:hypothetical protein
MGTQNALRVAANLCILLWRRLCVAAATDPLVGQILIMEQILIMGQQPRTAIMIESFHHITDPIYGPPNIGLCKFNVGIDLPGPTTA